MAMATAYGNRPTTRSTAATLLEVAQDGDYEGMQYDPCSRATCRMTCCVCGIAEHADAY